MSNQSVIELRGTKRHRKPWIIGIMALVILVSAAPRGLLPGHRPLARCGMPGGLAMLHVCKARRRQRTNNAPPSNSVALAGTSPEGIAVIEAIGQIARAMRLSGRDMERRLGLSGAQLLILQRLDATGVNGHLSVNELADLTQTGPSSVSEVVGRLASLGLVDRTRSATDGRSIDVSLTQAGILLLQGAPAMAQHLIAASVARMPERNRRQLARLLGQLAAQMELPEPAQILAA